MPAVTAKNDDVDAVYRDISEFRLHENIAELDAYGLTVVAAEKAAESGFAERALEAVLSAAQRRTGQRPDLEKGLTHANIGATSGQRGEQWLWRLLFDDPLFEQALMNRVCLALITYLLGYSAKLSNSSAVIKGPVDMDGPQKPLGLHSDNRGIPAPFPMYAQVANATWALTDYTLENGCVGYLPGSHLLCRQPTPDEALDDVVPVEAEAGSLIVWHGNTWHAPFPRTAPGLRVSLLFYFCRDYLTTQERYRDAVPAEVLARNPERFATLMGLKDGYGWDEKGPDVDLLKASRSGRSVHS